MSFWFVFDQTYEFVRVGVMQSACGARSDAVGGGNNGGRLLSASKPPHRIRYGLPSFFGRLRTGGVVLRTMRATPRKRLLARTPTAAGTNDFLSLSNEFLEGVCAISRFIGCGARKLCSKVAE
jgi:hypothetical protein